MIFAYEQTVIFAPQKCGTRSMDEIMHIATERQVLGATRRIAIVRDPIERAVSGFRFFYWMHFDERHVRTWEKWVNRTIDEVNESHWAPQADCINADIVTEWWRFERLDEMWHRDESLPPLPHRNKSTPARGENLTYRIQELELHYAADYLLRARCD